MDRLRKMDSLRAYVEARKDPFLSELVVCTQPSIAAKECESHVYGGWRRPEHATLPRRTAMQLSRR